MTPARRRLRWLHTRRCIWPLLTDCRQHRYRTNVRVDFVQSPSGPARRRMRDNGERCPASSSAVGRCSYAPVDELDFLCDQLLELPEVGIVNANFRKMRDGIVEILRPRSPMAACPSQRVRARLPEAALPNRHPEDAGAHRSIAPALALDRSARSSQRTLSSCSSPPTYPSKAACWTWPARSIIGKRATQCLRTVRRASRHIMYPGCCGSSSILLDPHGNTPGARPSASRLRTPLKAHPRNSGYATIKASRRRIPIVVPRAFRDIDLARTAS